jgi:hypothetical protein
MPDKGMTYEQAAHAMQSGVAVEQARGSQCGTPKHLRVGVNAAMADHAALAKLLIDKGVISEAEYLEALRLQMNEEVCRYQQRLKDTYGLDVTLG